MRRAAGVTRIFRRSYANAAEQQVVQPRSGVRGPLRLWACGRESERPEFVARLSQSGGRGGPGWESRATTRAGNFSFAAALLFAGDQVAGHRAEELATTLQCLQVIEPGSSFFACDDPVFNRFLDRRRTENGK